MASRKVMRPFVILRIFAAVFVTLVGLGMTFKSDVVVGAFIAAIGITFFVMLWLGAKTG